MSRFLVAAFAALLVVSVGVGCQNKSGDDSGAMKASGKDVCAMCPGVQKANADGKCEICAAKAASATGADVCTHCPGVQTATADGKCPACGAAVAAK
jgi:hypothetical protein